jgi:hypothetical protein
MNLIILLGMCCMDVRTTQDLATFKAEVKRTLEFEKAKLRTYEQAYNLSKETKQPLVVYIGCHENDIELFNSLKGKVILCYLPSTEDPLISKNTSSGEKVIFGTWDADGNLTRSSVAAEYFNLNPEHFLKGVK